MRRAFFLPRNPFSQMDGVFFSFDILFRSAAAARAATTQTPSYPPTLLCGFCGVWKKWSDSGRWFYSYSGFNWDQKCFFVSSFHQKYFCNHNYVSATFQTKIYQTCAHVWLFPAVYPPPLFSDSFVKCLLPPFPFLSFFPNTPFPEKKPRLLSFGGVIPPGHLAVCVYPSWTFSHQEKKTSCGFPPKKAAARKFNEHWGAFSWPFRKILLSKVLGTGLEWLTQVWHLKTRVRFRSRPKSTEHCQLENFLPSISCQCHLQNWRYKKLLVCGYLATKVFPENFVVSYKSIAGTFLIK